jgi:hypothetical protein
LTRTKTRFIGYLTVTADYFIIEYPVTGNALTFGNQSLIVTMWYKDNEYVCIP